MSEESQELNTERKGNRLGSILSTFALVISVIICLTVVTQVVSNGFVQLGGFSLFRVVTGSMEPELPVGSLLICRQTDVDEIQKGDIICFRSRNPQIMGKIITHRVINITVSGDGDVLLETKGDANLSADSEFVTRKNLIGRVDHYAKDGNLMASLVSILTDRIGFLMLILFPTLLIAGFILRSCMMNMRRDIEAALEEEKQKREAEDQLYTDEEYAEMLGRIRRELLQEMTQGAEENDEQTAKTSKTE